MDVDSLSKQKDSVLDVVKTGVDGSMDVDRLTVPGRVQSAAHNSGQDFTHLSLAFSGVEVRMVSCDRFEGHRLSRPLPFAVNFWSFGLHWWSCVWRQGGGACLVIVVALVLL